jgi:hypothetical protein
VVSRPPSAAGPVYDRDVISGGHVILFSRDAEADEAFFRGARRPGLGLVTGIKLPGGGRLGLYEPRHPIAHALPD